MMKIRLSFLIIALSLQSCNRLFTNNNQTANDSIFAVSDGITNDINSDSKIFKIQYQAYGDLNNDGLDDMVAVFAEKGNSTLPRVTHIFIQNQDNTYTEDTNSLLALPPAYSEHDFKMYDSEEISIVDGVLKIELYGFGGPVGNLFSHYKYNGSELELIYIETYNTGAGAWQNLYYDVKKGELTQVITDTMLEEMPTTENTFKIENKTLLFETTSPSQAIQDAFNKVEEKENW